MSRSFALGVASLLSVCMRHNRSGLLYFVQGFVIIIVFLPSDVYESPLCFLSASVATSQDLYTWFTVYLHNLSVADHMYVSRLDLS